MVEILWVLREDEWRGGGEKRGKVESRDLDLMSGGEVGYM